jgi:hypothetical protein
MRSCRCSSGGVGRMHNLDAGVTGKPGPVESENGGEAMHLHGGDQSRIMRGLPDHPVLHDQAFPRRIKRRNDQEFDQVLRNNVKVAAAGGQGFEGATPFRTGDSEPAESEATCWCR